MNAPYGEWLRHALIENPELLAPLVVALLQAQQEQIELLNALKTAATWN